MSIILAILKKEAKSYFTSPIAYVVLTFFLVLGGYYYYSIFTHHAEYTTFSFTQANWFTALANEDDATYVVIRDFYLSIAPFMFFILPLITMGSWAEERKRGTIELLRTTPASNWSLLAGKFLATVVFFLFTISPTVLYNVILIIFGDIHLGMLFSCYLGFTLFSMAILALGQFVSSLTESQIIAGIGTFGLGFFFYVIDLVGRRMETDMGYVLAYFSFGQHFENFARGVVETADVVFFVGMIFLGLFFTLRSLESVQWKA